VSGLGLRDVTPHVQLTKDRRGGGELCLRVGLIARPPVEGPEPEVAVRRERTHVQASRERERLSVCGFGVYRQQSLGQFPSGTHPPLNAGRRSDSRSDPPYP
jgi:hypothetical protein